MSPLDYKSIKLNRNEARKRIAEIMATHPGRVRVTRHAEQALADDGLSALDAINVLASGSARINEEGEFKDGSWRYRVSTSFLVVVIAFEPDGNGIVVITGWDKRK